MSGGVFPINMRAPKRAAAKSGAGFGSEVSFLPLAGLILCLILLVKGVRYDTGLFFFGV